MADNNIYKKILEKVSLDDLLKMGRVSPSAGLSPPPIDPVASAETSTDTIPLKSSEIITYKKTAAPEKRFKNLIGYTKFTKSSFAFQFPLFGDYGRLHYAQLVASGTAARLRYTIKMIQGIEETAKGKVSLAGIATESDLESFLSFSNIPFKNAPAEWLVYCNIYPERHTGNHTVQSLSLSIDGESCGTVYYVLPQKKRYGRTGLIFGNNNLGGIDMGDYRLGGVGLVCSGSSITSAEQERLWNSWMKSYFKLRWK